MAQVIPRAIEVPTRYADQTIGYEVFTLDRQLYSNFQLANKSIVPNTFEAIVNAPTNGGWIVWGLGGIALWLDTIGPQVTVPDFNLTLMALCNKLDMMVMPQPTINLPPVDTTEFMKELSDFAQSMTTQLDTDLAKNMELNKQLVDQMDVLTAKYNKLQFINDAAVEQDKLEDLRTAFSEFVDNRKLSRLPKDSIDLDLLINKVEEINNNKRQRDLDTINKFLSKLEAL